MLHVAIVGIDLKALAGVELGKDGVELVFDDGEDGADGLELGDDEESVGVGGVDDVTGIDKAESDASGDGGGDLAIREIELDGFDEAFVLLDYAFLLLDQ